MELLVLTLMLATPGVFAREGIELSRLFYNSDVSITGYCFRLTNATHQIGCSGSSSHTRGVLYYVDDLQDITHIRQNASHAPYVLLIEPEFFTAENIRNLSNMESLVKGLLVRNSNSTMGEESFLRHFSPERKCPNELAGDSSACKNGNYWNKYGTELIFTDFGNFPIFLLASDDFDDAVDCYTQYNEGARGGYGDFPLCSVEMVADMKVAGDTQTCRRRENLPIPYLNGERFCDPLEDNNVWGSLFNLTDDVNSEVIMLATKLDSISFFPDVMSFGASSEVAAIATMLAVIEQLGEVARTYKDNLNLTKNILYTFFQGESWDNIGSSKMAYDMKNSLFPEGKHLPRVNLGNISHFIELGQLGLVSGGAVYVHGNKSSNFRDYLARAGNITVEDSGREDLPPASLRRFLSEGVVEMNQNFVGSVITSFNDSFRNRFFGSRFDDENNFEGRTFGEVAVDLAALATAVAKAVLNTSQPMCSGGITCEQVLSTIDADAGMIEDVLTCFLSNASCDLFQGILVEGNVFILPQGPLPRYVGNDRSPALVTAIVQQLLAYYTAINASELESPITCKDCLKRIKKHGDPTTNVTWIPYGDRSELMCLCIESFTYTHTASSPLFAYKLGYDSQYSAWAESVWGAISVRFYLVTYPLQEVAFLFLGLFITSITLIGSVQCTRKGTVIFQARDSFAVTT